MAEPKVQLVAPIGNLTVPGMNVTGVVTASYSNVGVASSIIQGNNIDIGAGIITASSFVGDQIGTYRAGSLTGTPDLVVGVVTSSGLIGNITGDITGNLTGNVTGTAGSIISGNNLWVGIATATLVGPGGSIVGIAGSAFISQTVTANSGTTAIDLSAGNMITINQTASTAVSFANTSEAMDITIIRPTGASSSTTITWPSSINWNGGSAPTLINGPISGETQQFQLLTRDSGLTWYAWENMKNAFSAKYHLYTWGCDENGMLGHDTNFVHLSSPTQVPGVWAHVNVQRAQKKTVSATKPDGTLWMWGDNGDGRLANNDQASKSSPIQVGTETNWSLFNLGGSGGGILITKTDGTLWTWGRNYDGELGHNSHVRYSSPVQLPGTWATSQNSIMQTNDQTTGAIKADGTLWMWGGNDDGKLGLNDTTKRSSPVQVGTATDWSQINGSTTTAAIKTDGTLWVWGSNSNGRLGQNNTTNQSSPVQIPGTTWRNISSGGYGLSFATKTDNTGWLWGYGEYGTFGTGTQTVRRSSPTQIPGTWTQGTVALFPFTIAVKNGELWAWGRNNDQGGGNLGQNNRTSYYSPKQIPGTTWKYVWGSFAASFALKDAE